MIQADTKDDEELRSRAVRRLKKKRDFHAHLLVYALVNTSILIIWAVIMHGSEMKE